MIEFYRCPENLRPYYETIFLLNEENRLWTDEKGYFFWVFDGLFGIRNHYSEGMKLWYADRPSKQLIELPPLDFDHIDVLYTINQFGDQLIESL